MILLYSIKFIYSHTGPKSSCKWLHKYRETFVQSWRSHHNCIFPHLLEAGMLACLQTAASQRSILPKTDKVLLNKSKLLALSHLCKVVIEISSALVPLNSLQLRRRFLMPCFTSSLWTVSNSAPSKCLLRNSKLLLQDKNRKKIQNLWMQVSKMIMSYLPTLGPPILLNIMIPPFLLSSIILKFIFLK